MQVRFWGVRGSIPTPLSPEQIESKVINITKDVVKAGITDPGEVEKYLRSRYSRFQLGTVGGNTTCLSVEWPGTTVILDAGTGIRGIGKELMKGPCGKGEGHLQLLMTHTHWDHIQGLMFFPPVFQRNRISVYSGHEDIEARLRGQQAPEYFPVPLEIYPAQFDFNHVVEGQTYELPGGGSFMVHELNHPGRCFGYRIEHEGKSVVFATDSEYKRGAAHSKERAIEFFQDADLLVFDSQYTLEESLIKEDWGHSSSIMGVYIAALANVKRLALFHHEPNYADDFVEEMLNRAREEKEKSFPNIDLEILLAYEGLTVEI